MQIIIPMSGIGKRFLEAGYKIPKPLIEVDGKPIIEHVVNLFPGEANITFICNQEHLVTTNMREILNRIAPKGEIIAIAPHKKGPVFAVAQIFDKIVDDEEVIVNYCDFGTYWDYQDFLSSVHSLGADGAIPSYRGFHPHMLGSTNYAFIRDDNQWLVEIKEKEPFTNNRMNEFASNGTYYFKKGAYVKKYFQHLIDENIHLNGEFYVSLVYNLLQRAGLKPFVYEIQHMLQWGTPEDVQEYVMWSNYFKQLTGAAQEKVVLDCLNLIPLAGRGQRFMQDGYLLPKPLIPVSGKPMIVQAAEQLPPAKRQAFVCLKDHVQTYHVDQVLKSSYPRARFVVLDGVTEGQACSCAHGLTQEDNDYPLLIGACDNGLVWNCDKYRALLNDPSVDAIIWTFRNHPTSKRFPSMYGWVSVDKENNATGVSVKKALSLNPENDHAIIGTFYFKKADYFLQALEQLQRKNIRVNGEFYVDSCMNELIETGMRVKVFEVDFYVGWGTPNDLKTYEYWQSFFHKCSWHPYSLKKDSFVDQRLVEELNEKYYRFEQPCVMLQEASCQRATL